MNYPPQGLKFPTEDQQTGNMRMQRPMQPQRPRQIPEPPMMFFPSSEQLVKVQAIQRMKDETQLKLVTYIESLFPESIPSLEMVEKESMTVMP